MEYIIIHIYNDYYIQLYRSLREQYLKKMNNISCPSWHLLDAKYSLALVTSLVTHCTRVLDRPQRNGQYLDCDLE